MEVIRDLAACHPPAEGTVLTIGAYDGVHRGHQAVIAEVRHRAAVAGLRSAVVTFDRHPASVVRPESAPCLLTDLDQKLALLAATGVDATVLVPFDRTRAAEEPEDFVRDVLLGCLRARAVVVGEDFHFGRNRRGNVDLLAAMGAEHGFVVEGLQLIGWAGTDGGSGPVSSTAVRAALASGDLGAARAMLGRPHAVRGTVVRGDARGRELGFPTANVAVDPRRCMPAEGIYAGWYQRPDGSVYPAALSLGRRPTFHPDADSPLLEAYLLDTTVDLYGEQATVVFVTHLRGEQRFATVEALVAQMAADVDATREALAADPASSPAPVPV